MSRNGGKVLKHPFFVNENPAATLYRRISDQGDYPSRKKIINKSIREHFSSILNGTFIDNKSTCNNRNSSQNFIAASRAQTSLNVMSDYGQMQLHLPRRNNTRINKKLALISLDNLKPKQILLNQGD